MLYPTHQRFGILWGLLSFPLGVTVGTVPVIAMGMPANDLFMLIVCLYIGMRGALFGAEFPDIDSKSSIPRKKHPLIGRIFDATGVKHRGKYSHDFLSIGLTFGIMYILVAVVGDHFINEVATGNTIAGVIAYAGLLIFVWVLAMNSIDFVLWIANTMNNKKMWAIVNKNRIKYGAIVGVLLMVILFFSGVISVKALMGGVEINQSLPAAIMLVASFKVYIAFALAGAYSHLFADMLTKSGVSIFFKKLAPMAVISNVRKIPKVGKMLVPLDPKTGGEYENKVRLIVTIICIPATVIAIVSVVNFG